MKTTKQSLVVSHWTLAIMFCFLSSFILPSSSLSQIVVPKGWENQDSLRFGLFGLNYDLPGYNKQADSLADSVGCNFEEEFGSDDYNKLLFGHRKGYMGFVGGPFMDIDHLAVVMQQRIYYPSPDRIGLQFDNGYFWRYNDIRFNPADSFHNNTYDANDISLYSEYPRNDSIANLKYFTHQLDSAGHTTGDTVTFGNQGRVILGYSDNRFANQLLRTSKTYYHLGEESKPDSLKIRDTAKTFSATLEFNIDTSSINTSGSTLGHDNVPLLRFQILYKQGDTDLVHNTGGWSVLPFVPFKDSSHTTNIGWYKVIDTTITYGVYKTLPDNWRKEDIMESGSLAHSSWHFKQLHVMLKDMPQTMKNLIQLTPDDSVRIKYGEGTDSIPMTTFQHSDSLVASRMDNDALVLNRTKFLLETRVLSTYRATVRIRSMEWQDTTVDKILYRQQFSGDTEPHSCDPNGRRGGYDSLVNLGIKAIYDSCHKYGTGMREYIFNDNWAPYGSLSMSGIAYMDYFLSKYGMHSHAREQDWAGGQTEQFRRERLGYDGMPPSMYENQENVFVANFGDPPTDVFPQDYIYYGHAIRTDTTWPKASQDNMVGIIIGRQDFSGGGHDTLEAYKRYTDLCAGLNTDYPLNHPFLTVLRNSVHGAHNHPANKRFAIESDIQGWGIAWHLNGDPYRYYQRPTTPEETSAMIYGAIANGVTSLSVAQAFDASYYSDAGAPGLFGVRRRTSNNDITDIFVNNYNYGHRNSKRDTSQWFSPTSNEWDIDIPYYYLGYSNTFRAFKRAISRINQIYDTTHGRNEIPFRRFTWLDAYSTNKAISNGTSLFSSADSATRSNAFLKCFCTTSVKRWSRDSTGKYIDSLSGGNLKADSAHRTYIEVGLFKDSINAKTKNYAALVVNTRLWPSLRDASDSIYYNQGLDSAKDRSRSTLGDIDTRRVWFVIDTNAMDPSARCASYYVHDLWKPDSIWVVSNDTISVYIKPGDAKFLYITPATGLNLGRLTDNEYNNGRHIAAIDTAAQGIKQYVCTYARNGKICVSYPVETPANPDRRKAGTPVDSVIYVDTASFNPSIAYNHADNSIGVTWRKVVKHNPNPLLPGAGYDTTWICFSRASYSTPYHFSPMKVLDTLFTSYGYISPPAIAPRDSSINSSLRTSDFWVAYNCIDSGETLVLVDTNGIVTRKKHFWSPDRQFIYHKFVSIATHVPYDTVHLSFEEGLGNEGQIYYTKGFIDSATTSLQVTTNPAVSISGSLHNCENHCPQTAILPNNEVDIAWEAIERFPINPPDTMLKMIRHHSVFRKRGGNGNWSDYTTFRVWQDTIKAGDPPYTSRIYVNITCSISPYIWTDTIPWMDWRDYWRLTWNNLTTGSIELARYGHTPFRQDSGWAVWRRYDYPDLSWEPSMPTLSFGNLTSHVFSYRSKVQHEDGLYDARITRNPFPVNDAGNGNAFQIIRSFADSQVCSKPVMNAKVGSISIISSSPPGVHGVSFHSLLDSVNDPHGTMPIAWNDKRAVRTFKFHISPGDTLKYQRAFTVGEHQAGDTTAVADSLKGSSDYLRARIYLRSAINDSVLAILDSARLNLSGFIQSGSLHDSCYKRYTTSYRDSVYMTMEMSRGDTTNSYKLTHIEAYDDYFFGSPIAGDTLSYKTSAPNEHQVSAPENPIKVSVIPNPFYTMAQVSIDAPKDIPLNITLFDELGRKVTELTNGIPLQSHSEFTITSQTLSSGFYLLRVQSGNKVVTRKIQLIK